VRFVDALSLERFVLLGASQGASISIQYAVRNRKRLSHLIIYGGFARGLLHRGDPERQKQLLELNRTMIREGWGSHQEAYRQWFTSQFILDGTAEHNHWSNEPIPVIAGAFASFQDRRGEKDACWLLNRMNRTTP
jgi:pimeloyl-ACP methyl ester carboxylesterase